MKAKLFIANESMEIVLDNGTKFESVKDESEETFVTRVTNSVLDDLLEDLEIKVTIDHDTFKGLGIKKLQELRKNKEGVELQIIQEILLSRGALEEHPSPNGAIYNGTLGESDIKKIDGSTPKKKSKKKEVAEVAEKEKRALKKQITPEEALTKLEAAEKNKGHYIEFMCTKTKELTTGIIRGVRLDKRNNFIQYRIEVMEGKEKVMYGKGIDAKENVVGELAEPTESTESTESDK